MTNINGKNYSKEDIQLIANECKSKSEMLQRLGFSYQGGGASRSLNKIISQLNIDISNFDASYKTKSRRIYKIIYKICSICGLKFSALEGSPKEKKSCSKQCSNILFASLRHSKKSNKKTSQTLLNKSLAEGTRFARNCNICGEQYFTTKGKQKKYCSNSCAKKRPQNREKLSAAAKARVANGTHKGWQSRSKIKPSYPELYFILLLVDLGFIVSTSLGLKTNSMVLRREFKQGKWFIDFADISNKLALEIDGKQHKFPDRLKSDQEKDKFLTEYGWKIKRIEWRKPNKEFREFVLNELRLLFSYL